MAKIALLVGVSEYGSNLAPLRDVEAIQIRDVEAIQRVLVHPEMGGYDPANVIVLKNPERQEIEEAICNLFTFNRQKDDLLLFYFSGHGIKDDRDKLYLATCTTRKDYDDSLVTPSAVSASFLHDTMNNCRSQRQVIVLDCCFSGAIASGMTVKNDGSVPIREQFGEWGRAVLGAIASGMTVKNDGSVPIREQFGGWGRAVLTSSTSTQYSFGQEDQLLSTYTQYLVEGIETGAADIDNDGWISAEELHEYALVKVKEVAPAMTPKFYPVQEGYKILIAKSPKDDPRLKYRKEVEVRAKQSQGRFSIVARALLDMIQTELNIFSEDAKAIENEVLQPYLEYERKLAEFTRVFTDAVNQNQSFKGIEQDLTDYQGYLGLRDVDVCELKERVLSLKKPEELRVPEKAAFLKQEKEIFISYAWGGESEEIVNQLDEAFQSKDVKIIRDKRDLGYKGLIKEFMEQIGQGKCVIAVISDKYLKSPNCMFELVQVAKNGQFKDRIFPVVLSDAQIYNPVERIRYIKHWEDQIKALDEAMKGVSAANLQGFREEIDQYTEIRNTIAELANILRDMNTLTSGIHIKSNFETLLWEIERKVM